ncbi:MAG: hypothetical protein PF541_03635 [Prolixibacteraceae bacterium]|jgi:hypothetical protein|nr:hypothetical protein [Prolixibacteraceae bacterium]
MRLRLLIILLSFLSLQACASSNTSVKAYEILLLKKELPEVQLINFLADTTWSIRERNPELAIELGKAAIKKSIESNIKIRVPELYNYGGAIDLNYLHDFNNSVPYFEKGYELSVASNDSIQLGYAYNNWADLYYKTNNLALAIKYDTL